MCDRAICFRMKAVTDGFGGYSKEIEKPFIEEDAEKRRKALDLQALALSKEITALFVIDQEGNVSRDQLRQRILLLSKISNSLLKISLTQEETPLEEVSMEAKDEVAMAVKDLIREILPDCQLSQQ